MSFKKNINICFSKDNNWYMFSHRKFRQNHLTAFCMPIDVQSAIFLNVLRTLALNEYIFCRLFILVLGYTPP